MDAYECLVTRRSCRSYTEKQVDRATLDAVLAAGQYAPSGMGRQPVTFVAIQDTATRNELARMNAAIMGTDGDPFYGAPTVIVVLVDADVPTSQDDGALALGNMLNAAHAKGLGACWIHRAYEEFESDEGKALLKRWGLPADGSLRGIGHCILGYAAAPAPEPKPRRDNVIYVD